MKLVKRFVDWYTNRLSNQKLGGKVIMILLSLFVLCCLCSVPIALLNPSSSDPDVKNESIARTELSSEQVQEEKSATSKPSRTPRLTNTPGPTNTLKPTLTPRPTNTPLPPTATPDPNQIDPGMYLVGSDIRPGLYKGVTGVESIWDSCYWERKKDLSGNFESILANDNSVGQFYIEVAETDYALETACPLVYLENGPVPVTEFPQKIDPGMYLVNVDIQPGTYKGEAGTDVSNSCYWERLSNLTDSLYGILANDNSVGQFYVQVAASDYVLNTACELERVGD